MVGLGTFRSISTPVANITTNNVTTLNVSGTGTITKLSINSSMRSNNDLFNCSTSSTGPYLFIGGDATIGTYDTNNSIYPWFIEMDGDAKFNSINCTNTTTTSKLTVTNTKQNISTSTSSGFDLTTSTAQIIYLSYSGESQFINFAALGPDYNFNIYEFRTTSTNVNTVMRFRGGPSVCPIVDLNNVSSIIYNDTLNRKYFKFQYIYAFPGQSVINTYYELN
jgi:hypothetical protein